MLIQLEITIDQGRYLKRKLRKCISGKRGQCRKDGGMIELSHHFPDLVVLLSLQAQLQSAIEEAREREGV